MSLHSNSDPVCKSSMTILGKTRIVMSALLIVAGVCGATRTAGAGVVFQQICAFPTAAPGPWHPACRLVEGSDGSFYGTTRWGGSADLGSIFKLAPNGALTPLVSFTGANGRYPSGGLALGTDGNFYGAAGGTGATDHGTIFRMTPSGVLQTLASFQATNGDIPFGRLERGSNGNFYGTTFRGGAFDLGTVFAVSSNGALTTLISFAGTNGCNPEGGVVAGDDGAFYGTTEYGGSGFTGSRTGSGTVFRVTTNGTLATLAYFAGTKGSHPLAGLARGADGNLYGTASSGGANGLGTLFRVTPGGLLTTLVDFGPAGGVKPYGGVTLGSDGNFYGTTAYRIENSGVTNGTVFKVTTNGSLTTLVNLDGTNGLHPFNDLVLASDGNLYGAMADATGVHSVNGGTVFRLAQRPVITSLTSSNGSNTVSWSSFANGTYRVESSMSVTGTDWTPRPPTFTANNSNSSFTEPAAAGAECYYRVVLLP
jgi:uncharacterized repeat protein (TIGR03803 family)